MMNFGSAPISLPLSSGLMTRINDMLDNNSEESRIRSRRIDYSKCHSQFVGARFIFECGYKLKAEPATIAAAAVIFHKFLRDCSDPKLYCKYLIGATALHIAGKMKDEKYKLRDVINVANKTVHRSSAPLDFSAEYFMRRDSIVQFELLIVRVLGFKINFTCPHKFLLHYLKTLQTWLPREDWDTVPLCPTSFAFLQDFHHDPAVLDYPPQMVAIACIQLAMQCYGIDVPYTKENDEFQWYTRLYRDADREVVWTIMELLMENYNKDFKE